MSTKRNLPTFQLQLLHMDEWLEGPIFSPDERAYVERMPQLHAMLTEWQAVLIYAGEWQYVPYHAIRRIRRGRTRFTMPWPIVNDDDNPLQEEHD